MRRLALADHADLAGPYLNAVMPRVEAEIQHAIEASKVDKAKSPGT